MTIYRVTPTSEGQLELGATYQICGSGEEGVGMLPLQLFRYESQSRMDETGTVLLMGTLFWKYWFNGRWFSGPPMKDHFLALHHVSIGVGSRLSSRHDFHLEKVEPKDIGKLLGYGRLYDDYIRDENERAGRKVAQPEIITA